MGFYEQISKYYDLIFPTGKAQLEFIMQSAGQPPTEILDVACGSGGYSVELAKEGYKVTAVDLDEEMVRLAKEKVFNEKLGIDVRKCDMRDIEKTFDKKFNCIFCIGNSIVHLGSLNEIENVVKQMYHRLSYGGALILQIINYDRVLKFKVSELPSIENAAAGLKFVRKYEYDTEKGVIYFNTTLTIENNDTRERYDNSIELFPVTSCDMEKIFGDTLFREVSFYGDFNCSPYNENSFMLVIRAKK